jgi:hypothetical protein
MKGVFCGFFSLGLSVSHRAFCRLFGGAICTSVATASPLVSPSLAENFIKFRDLLL